MNITDNPFFTLGVSTRADRKQIASAADAKAFVKDSEAVRAARTSLVIPSKRLYAEIRWFPGTEDANVREIVSFLRRFSARQQPPKIDASIFKGLTLLNFAVYVFNDREFRDTAGMSKSILTICECFDELSVEKVCAVINNDRTIAGFPSVSEQELGHELNDYRRDILRNIDGRMSTLSPEKYTELLEELADSYADDKGDYHVSLILDDIMAGYELRILPQLEEQIRMIFDSVASVGDYVPEKVFAELPERLKEWRKLAEPLVKVSRSTGMEDTNIHKQGAEIFDTVREKAIDLHNEHGRTGDALRLILAVRGELADVSAELLRVIDSDVKALRSIEEQQQKAKREREAWEKSLYYETELGLIFKDKLIISAEGISWNGRVTPLDAISGVRWGGIRQYVNGFHTRTDYVIVIQTQHGTIKLTPKEKKYQDIITHLWKALAVSISMKILQQLKNGEMLCFGNIKLKDNGVYLKKSGWFSSDTKFFAWTEPLRIYSYNGSLVVAGNDYSAAASYMDDMNTHILESILRHFLRKTRRSGLLLSSLLDE